MFLTPARNATRDAQLVVEDEAEDDAGPDDVLEAEGVDGRILCRSGRE